MLPILGVTAISAGILAVLFFLGLIIINQVLNTASSIISDILLGTLARDLITLPNFGYVEDSTGEIYKMYVQFQWISLILLAAGIAITVTGHFVSGRSQFWRGRIISIIVTLLVILAFPFIWDLSTNAIENMSSLVLNPVYTLDKMNPCPVQWSKSDIIKYYNESPYLHSSQDKVGFFDDPKRAYDACRPDWKVKYMIYQVGKKTDHTSHAEKQLGVNWDEIFVDPWEWINGNIILAIQTFIEGLFISFAEETFWGIIKSIITIQFTITAILIAIMVDLLAVMIISALPILLVMRLFPPFTKIVDKMLMSLPGLFMTPFFASLILSIGLGVAVSDDIFDTTHSVGPIPMSILYAWFTSLAVLFMASTVPVMLVPLISQMMNNANGVITNAVMSGAVMVTSTTLGTISGGVASMARGGGLVNILKGITMGAGMGIQGGMARQVGFKSMGTRGLKQMDKGDSKGDIDNQKSDDSEERKFEITNDSVNTAQ